MALIHPSHGMPRARSTSVALALALALATLLAAVFPGATGAQPSPCQLLAPHELSAVMPAVFGPGVETVTGCRWETETRDGHVILVELDTSGDAPAVSVTTDDPGIDADALSSVLALLAAERLASGEPAPTVPPPGAGLADPPDLCALFSPEDVGAMLGVALESYGGGRFCGWKSAEERRVMPGGGIGFYDEPLDQIVGMWPDAVATEVLGFPAFEYGWDTSMSRARYLSVDLGEAVLSAEATSDVAEIDPATVARQLVEETLRAMGLGEPAP